MSSDSEYEMWIRTDTEEDVWSDRETGWPVRGVVGEEIDTFGETRYEIRWDDWERHSDHTNTTWMADMPDRPDLMKTWKQRQNAKRRGLATESLDVDPRLETGVNMPYTNTILRSQAFEEKLKKRKLRGYADFAGWEDEVAENRRRMLALDGGNSEGAKGRSLRDSTVRQQSAASSSSKQSSASLKAGSASTTSRLTPNPPPQSANSNSGQSRPPRSLLHNALTERSSSTNLMKFKMRLALSKEWTAAAKKFGAAPVYIVNNHDDEEIPSLSDNFQYCESFYMHDDDIIRTPDAGLFVTCDCLKCSDATECTCQHPSELVDGFGNKVFAYTSDVKSSRYPDFEEVHVMVQGLFRFNVEPGVEVIECNQYCRCGKTCINRVAQRPRNVPIEIFKTPFKGWGARATKSIKQGKVLGIYTGKLVRRNDIESLPDDERNYCFDLDGRESNNDEDGEDRYTVNSHACGNWTRFLNHSCAPNMQVYPVLFDTIPELSMPYLAFVSTRDIPEREELTFEYDPAAARTRAKGNRKGKKKVPRGAKRCECGAGAGVCREWVRI